LKIWKKNHRWLVTLFEFCPKNLSLYFFHFLHSKTFPKWYNTCVYVNRIERNVNFDVFFYKKRCHLKKNILRKLIKIFSVDHKNWFYIYFKVHFFEKEKIIEIDTHTFFQLWKFEKKSSMTGHPIWILSQKFNTGLMLTARFR
jgi:hypothetical protein